MELCDTGSLAAAVERGELRLRAGALNMVSECASSLTYDAAYPKRMSESAVFNILQLHREVMHGC